MSRFLRFIVEREIAGRGSELKEYTIGLEVFDRPKDYDPRVDPIVRVEARRLRSKLQTWYECSNSPIRIELPKGSYVPKFVPGTSGAPAVATHSPHGKEQAFSVAVLPFANPSGNADAQYLSDGLTQQIIQRLTRVPGLRVLGWTTASQMRERQDVTNIARELNATHVLTGSVRQSGSRLRTFAQLVEPATAAFLWSDSWDRPMGDLFQVEEDIAAAIVSSLGGHLGFAPGASCQADSCDLYYRARWAWNQRTGQGMRDSVALLREAVAIAPDFALAWAGLADSLAVMAQLGVVEPWEAIEHARQAAERALELSPELGEAEASLGLITAVYDWEWNRAELHFQRAMQLNPGYPIAFFWYSLDYCAYRGYFREAEAALAEAEVLDPLSSMIGTGRPYLLMLERRYEEALSASHRIMQLDPNFARGLTMRGRILIQCGKYREAVETLSSAYELSGIPSTLGALGQAWALNGETGKALEALRRLQEMRQRGFIQASCLAAVMIGLGDYEDAVAILEHGAERRELSIAAIGAHPLYDPLRGMSRFDALVKRLGC
ncbi:MAG TPA: hypothetical protein VES20_03110 [Bryobacteraceae bacterium]|nr:hypothetical protein [Bryobacteraceae bacterium]